jgi:hypothetical protein
LDDPKIVTLLNGVRGDLESAMEQQWGISLGQEM